MTGKLSSASIALSNAAADINEKVSGVLEKFQTGVEMMGLETNPLDDLGLGDVASFFSVGIVNDGPIFDPKQPSPSKAMERMKTKKDKDGLRVYSDLDVMNLGMAYIIRTCLHSVESATDTLLEMEKIGPMTCFWTCMPWKMQKTLDLREKLGGHREALVKNTQALQAAIGVASYAVQLESLESALDCSTTLKNRDMRLLWKKKLGGDKTKVKIVEFCEAFFSRIQEFPSSKTVVVDGKSTSISYFIEKREAYLKSNKNFKGSLSRTILEKIGRNKDGEILLTRFLNELFNR